MTKKKETTYQKNKRLLAEASEDIRELCLNPDSERSLLIKTRVHLANDSEKAHWIGCQPNDTHIQMVTFDGFISKITN